MFSVSSGIMDADFYNEFIAEYLKKDDKKLFENVLECMEYIEYYAIQLPSHSPVHYHEILLCDVHTEPGCYYPFLNRMINGSSAYAMCRSGMDRDDDESETLEWSVDEMIDRVPNEWKECVKNFFN